MSRDYPVETRPEDTTRAMERRRQGLPVEQVIREMFMNPIEHRVPDEANIAMADVEKLAATHLRDGDGNPVFRRVWVDNCSGIPHDDMPVLLRFNGQSSKPSTVFSGNHGEGAILTNGMANPNGLVFISKTADADEPSVSIWDITDTGEGSEPEGGLRSFETVEVDDDDDEETVTKSPIAPAWQVPYLELEDGTILTMADVWERAFDNNKFNYPPEHGTVVVEMGEDDLDSTYMKTQRTRNSQTKEWEYSRWAVGDFMNGRFMDFPEDITLFWGVPGTEFEFNFGKGNARRKYTEYAFKPGKESVSFVGPKTWGYRQITGLTETIGAVSTRTVVSDPDTEMDAEDAKISGATIITDSVTYHDCVMPFRADVFIRELPAGVEARKLPFMSRRFGRVFINFNEEVFAKLDGEPHGMFGVTNAAAKYSVWISITPLTLGKMTPGAVWMQAGRTGLRYFDKDGMSSDIPWREIAAAFRAKMPAKLVAWIKKQDAATTTTNMTEPEIKALLDQFEDRTAKPRPAPKAAAMKPTTKPESGTESSKVDEIAAEPRKRGPIVNPGATHPKGPGEHTRNPPTKPGTTTLLPAKKSTSPGTGGTPPRTPLPPMHVWIVDEVVWPTEARWAVLWEEPSTANEKRGKVYLNWNHWYIQEVFEKMAAATERPMRCEAHIKRVFTKSVLTKIAHRRKEIKRKDLGMTPKDSEIILSPAALTGSVLGWWDHHFALEGSITEIAAASDDTDEESAA